jgi:hypothetical protein
MLRSYIWMFGVAMLGCEVVEEPTAETSTTEQKGATLQGATLQGATLQGATLQGATLQGVNLGGATMSGDVLTNLRVDRGELVAQRGTATLRGTALVGAQLIAQARNLTVTPPTTALIEYRIAEIIPEPVENDPTRTGNTFLYTLEQWVAEAGAWQPACPADADGRHVAIPVAGTWNERGDRVESSTMFTFGCTTGVIAKCYRWGYRPWITGYGADMVAMHQTCTRLARADYCGNGVPHTQDGTKINVWDTLPLPGPIQRSAPLMDKLGMLFEAGWNTGGAVCLSHTRWVLGGGLAIAQVCPDRLLVGGVLPLVCNTVAQVLGHDANAKMFNEAYLNIDLGPLGP